MLQPLNHFKDFLLNAFPGHKGTLYGFNSTVVHEMSSIKHTHLVRHKWKTSKMEDTND